MYIPNHNELIEMGFTPREWEGVIYRYDFHALTYSICQIDGTECKEGKSWWLSLWYQPWYPRTRADVELVIRNYTPE